MRSLPSAAGPAVLAVLTAFPGCAGFTASSAFSASSASSAFSAFSAFSAISGFAPAAAAAPAGATPSPAAPVPECRVAVHGSRSAATCHNPTPETVRLQLHVLCRRWWDPATDTRPAAVGPAQTAVLAGHCWKEIRAVWVTRR